jgi:alpha-L-fucosidase
MPFPRAVQTGILRCSASLALAALVMPLTAALPAAPDDNGAPVPDNPTAVTTDHATNSARAAAVTAWQEARFGLFLHWGVYSVYGGTYRGKELWSAEWIQENARIPWAEYSATAADWNPSHFDAEAWVKTARDAGMRYIVITAKHHDGFALYPSKASGYNLMKWSKYRGPDPLAALKAACKKHGLLFGIYYSPLEFRLSPNGFDETDAQAIAKGFNYQTLGPKPYAPNAEVVKLAQAQIKELAEWYQPDIFWFDGTWSKMGTWTEADGLEAERVIRAAVPNVLINNRLGLKRGDFNTIEGKLPLKAPKGTWEYCWNLGAFWGYNPRNYAPKQMKTPEHYIETLVNTASMGGNYLLNVGPDPTGSFHPMAVDYLKKIGEWVNANEECIRGVSASPLAEKPAWGYLTQRDAKVYLIVKEWPIKGDSLVLPALKKRPARAYLLRDATKRSIEVVTDVNGWTVTPRISKPDEPFTVIVLEITDQLTAAQR